MENNNKHNRCTICRSNSFKRLFHKRSEFGETFYLLRCSECGLEYINPVPSEEEIQKYYRIEYFTRRTERGYNNYFSGNMKREIERIIKLNLNNLSFYEYERAINGKRRVLDIGCAAGYFVKYMSNRNWHSIGIDISNECVDFARDVMKQDVIQGNYLDLNFKKRFHLITLWATIEHLHHPDRVLKKIYHDLEDSGILYLSTCRIGGINFMKLFGKKWRFYNFPEHLFFFSYRTIKKLLEQNGFSLLDYTTYGSGFGKNGTVFRKAADYLAKRFNMGDMMLISAGRRNGRST